MKLKFNPSLPHQKDAIDAVVDLFKGQLLAQFSYELGSSGKLIFTEFGIRNNISLHEEQLLENIRAIQERNNIEKIDALESRNFSIEMETGTGKTYVYLRTIFELSKVYGFTKFMIAVPSVAIREGVLKSIDMMKEHFRILYNGISFEHFVYDSSKLNMVNAFARSNALQIMIINIQSFQRDANIFNQEHERCNGYRPKDVISSTNPILIIDEPQSVDSGKQSQEAIKSLESCAILRYSATHKNPHNLLYKLDPIKAYDLRLVKRIEVASIQAENNFNDAYIKLLRTDNKNGIKAQLEIHQANKSGALKPAKIWVKQGDDLHLKSAEHSVYRHGYMVQCIDCTPGSEFIEFSNGQHLVLEQGIGDLKDDVMQVQISETIEQHLKKEREFRSKGIKVKVLSLFFIDKVSNYRIYNIDGTTQLGKIGLWFEEAYKKISSKDIYQELTSYPIEKIHNGYFSKDRRGHVKDTTGITKDDEDTYNLIMKDKERLLSIDEPLKFIFSHSALKEGWDNPNIFQICTLNETKSADKKRQEIGRGLRLPVDEHGDRIEDKDINRLTVIANESYEQFAKTLQNEFEEDYGVTFGVVEPIAFAHLTHHGKPMGQEASKRIWQQLFEGGYINHCRKITEKFDPQNPHFDLKISNEFLDLKNQIIDVIERKLFKSRIVDARDKKELKLNKRVQLGAEFQELWERIKHKTRYRVKFSTDQLVNRAVKRIKKLEKIKSIRISMERAEINVKESGIEPDKTLENRNYEISYSGSFPDIIAYLQKETELTRHTLVQILKKSERLQEFCINPQVFMSAAKREIDRALQDLMIEGIWYEKTNSYWEMQLFEEGNSGEITRYLRNLYEIKNKEKSLYDCIEIDSKVEEKFAKDLDNNESIKLFMKLPRWFQIDTPIGRYNPDWAFITQKDEKLYFVAETKSTFEEENLRGSESNKIKCAEKHFKILNVNYQKAVKLSDVLYLIKEISS